MIIEKIISNDKYLLKDKDYIALLRNKLDDNIKKTKTSNNYYEVWRLKEEAMVIYGILRYGVFIYYINDDSINDKSRRTGFPSNMESWEFNSEVYKKITHIHEDKMKYLRDVY
jgi:hypothetical protein